MKLRNVFCGLDPEEKKSIDIDKFIIECEGCGIGISKEDIEVLLLLHEVKDDFNTLKSIPAINYEMALKNIVPSLKKNGDRLFDNDGPRNFKIGWTITNNARTRAAYMKKLAQDKVTKQSIL